MQLETERLLLRPFGEEDLDLVFQLYSDEEVLHYTPFDPMSREQASGHLSRMIQDWSRRPQESFEFAMILKSSGEKIGRCHILINPETDTGMIGWLLLREHRGKRYSEESGEALIRCCFEDLGLHRVNAVCNPGNIASRKALEHLGLRLEAHFRQKCRYVKRGAVSWEDELEYAMLVSDPGKTAASPD